MRKVVSIILFLLLLAILSAWNEEKVSTFLGENENWLVKFNITSKSGLNVNNILILGNVNKNFMSGTYEAQYKGENLEELLNKKIVYEVGFEEPTSGSAGFLNDEGILKGKFQEKKCFADCEPGSELIFNITIDGKEETITLHRIQDRDKN